DAPVSALVAGLWVGVVAPPGVVAELIAIDDGRERHDAGRRSRRRVVAVAAAGGRVADALHARLRAAAVVRERHDRRLAIPEPELERVIAAERVRKEVRAVGLHVP